MKATVGDLREIVASAMEEGRVGASASYLKKERVRETLQAMIVDGIRSGEVSNQGDVDEFVATVMMALNALKMVPFKAYKLMSHDKR